MSDVLGSPARLHLIGLAGSLRLRSYNRALLQAACELAPAGLSIEVYEVGDLPLFNEDLESEGPPVPVSRLRNAVRAADGVLLVTPEYNHGVPGVLKNAVDWLSQPLRQSALEGKPAAMMGASTGQAGTARSQSQLRQAFVLTNSPMLQQPEVLVGRAHEKFDAEGRLTDPVTREFVAIFLPRLAHWLAQQKRALITPVPQAPFPTPRHAPTNPSASSAYSRSPMRTNATSAGVHSAGVNSDKRSPDEHRGLPYQSGRRHLGFDVGGRCAWPST